jgi:predicted nuclease of predicted toxin-antitoxin system
MRFLADMGVSQRVVTWLREQGHDAIHLRDEGLQRLANGDIFTKAFRGSCTQPLRIIVAAPL